MCECIICNENDQDFMYYKLENNSSICDCCYQELGMLKKINNKWIECVVIEGNKVKLVK